MVRFSARQLLCIFALIPATAFAHRPTAPTGHAGIYLPPFRSAAPDISGQWQPLKQKFPGNRPDTALLRTDGVVMMHDACTPNWYQLTPDKKGSYVKGTWSEMPPMPKGYAPLYFASQVHDTGYVIISGGEYNGKACTEQETNNGALFDPNYSDWGTWGAPSGSGWSEIGDGPSVLLASGVNGLYDFMIGSCCSKKQAAWGYVPLGWVRTDANKADVNSEEGWTLLQDGNVLTVDTFNGAGQNSPAEIFSPSSNAWSSTGTAVNALVDPVAHEIGPAVVLPDGNVFQAGANSCAHGTACPGHTGIYIPATETWQAGPDFPSYKVRGGTCQFGSGKWYFDVSDGPAALLVNGRILVQASPNWAKNYCSPSHFFEFDEASNSLKQVNEPLSAPCVAAFQGRMLELPSGQVLWSSASTDPNCTLRDVEVYTPNGAPDPSWVPSISFMSTTSLTRGGQGYYMRGRLFMGLSQGAAYGDDAQMSTNRPIVEITNSSTGDMCFARTYYWYANGSNWVTNQTQTEYDVPTSCEPGDANLRIVANGIASQAVAVTIN